MTSPIDISPVHQKIVCEILSEHLPSDVKVWVFGSRADWTTKNSSDLDLALEGKSKLNYKIISILDNAFEDSDLPYMVDIIDLNNVNNNFKQIVNKKKIRLHINSQYTSNKMKRITLDKFSPFVYGKSLPETKRNIHGDVPVIGSNGIIGYHDVALTHGPTIIIGRKDTVGAIHYVPKPCWPIDTTFYVTGDDELLMRFKYYALKTLNLDQMNSDSAVPGLNRDAAHARSLYIPSKINRRIIAHILDTLDNKIELNRYMGQTLEKISHALFKSWFVDFEPVHAKMNGHWKRGKSLPGLSAHLYDIFPDRLIDSELGEIPEGWKAKPIDKIANFRNGLALQNYRPKENEPRLPVVKIAQLRNGQVDNKEWAKEDIISECIICDGDVVFSWSGSLLVKIWCGGRAALNQHLFKVTSYEYPKWFYLLWLERHLKKFQSIAAGKATTMGRIQRHHLSEVKCIVPNNDLLNAANEIFGYILAKQISNDMQSRLLIDLRDMLLPKLVSGELQFTL